MTAKASFASREAQRSNILINAARTSAMSEAAAASDAIEAAVSGDLISASPELAATIADLNARIVALETP